ncbi:MAG: rhodanese-like domain-containing protein [Hyphomicrobiales bacterium]
MSNVKSDAAMNATPAASETPTETSSDDTLQTSQIASNVSQFGYAGDVSERHAFVALSHNAIIVDVRTRAEWSFVGVPAIAPEKLVLCEWQVFPDMQVNPAFIEQTRQEIMARSGAAAPGDAPQVFFLCRSGARSRSAAIAMTEAGFPQCFNIENGFEGAPDHQGHRGVVNGWKASDLPWRQS